MSKRKVEVFTAGCELCRDAVELVKRLACDSCEVSEHNVQQADVASRAKLLGVQQVPAVVVDGSLVACCAGGPSEAALRAAGIGVAKS